VFQGMAADSIPIEITTAIPYKYTKVRNITTFLLLFSNNSLLYANGRQIFVKGAGIGPPNGVLYHTNQRCVVDEQGMYFSSSQRANFL